MNEDDLLEHLICPDCRQRIEFTISNRLICTACKRVFNVENNFIQMLPAKLRRNYEDDAWRRLPFEGEDQPALTALLHKKYRVSYFQEKVLPTADFRGRVLEVGAGTSWASALVKKAYPASLVVASDISPFALEKGLCVANLLKSALNYRIASDAECLPFEEGYFDVVLSNATIHHFSNPQVGVCEMRRVLRKGGKCYALGELAAGAPFRRFLASDIGPAGRRARVLGIKERMYSLKEWLQFFEHCGFEDLMVNFDKTWQHKLYSFSTALYYGFLSAVPNFCLGDFLPCNVDIYATKT